MDMIEGIRNRMRSLGPGILVTAAFIGPGTVTTCSKAGSDFGYALVWALLFSIVATLILQEMAARLGLISGQGLGYALRSKFAQPMMRLATIVLVGSAIFIGNAAYQGGNIAGGALAFSILGFPNMDGINIHALLIGAVAFALLWRGSYKLMERFLIGAVLLMSVCFLVTCVLLGPNVSALLSSFFPPRLPAGSTLLAMGIIGTTVVPYNLFLHASAVSEKWKDPNHLSEVRFDTVISITIGGLISLCILLTSAVAFHGSGISLQQGSDMALLLEPVMGTWSKYLIALGLLCAGISSAVTAPLAGAYALRGVMGWDVTTGSWRFRLVWILIMITGLAVSSLGLKPIQLIVFAQAANGFLLPIIAIALLFIVNDKKIMKGYTNNLMLNVFGSIVILISVLIGLKNILSAFGVL